MLNAKRLGLAAGIVWGLTMFLMTLFNIWFGYGSAFLSIMESIYPGYDTSYFGSILALVYGFIDGFVGFFLIGWFYNKLG